jgi:two-component system OmpR family sensor kinase
VTFAPASVAGDDEARPRRRRFRRVRTLSERTPLRVKLVLSVLVLATLGLFVAGAAAATNLRSYMVQRVDQQFPPPVGGRQISQLFGPPDGSTYAPATAAQRVQQFCLNTAADLRPQTVRTEYRRCSTSSGASFSATLLSTGTAKPNLPTWTAEQATAHGTKPFTVASVGGGPEWRVQATVRSGYVIMVANSLSEVDSTVSKLERDEFVIGLIVLALIAVFGYWVVRRSLRPLADVEHTAAAIADGDLTRRVPHRDPRTEVGRLALSVNRMLSQIETSFRIRRLSEEAALASEQRMRRFVTDASHELRTPLTSIRGFAELYRQGAAGHPEDVARLMRRIEDEAARMGLLVDDLLLLARLDQQRPLEREIVDLVVIAADSVHDAAAVAPDRAITLEVIAGPTPPEIVGDESRLRQVIANLVTNALTHTPPGTPITVRVGSRVESTGLFGVLEVADRGQGLDAEASARVFERFYRADPSRTRSLGGTGLGLSIVAALVAAHGGRVELETSPGQGATFRVLLPAAPDPELHDDEDLAVEETDPRSFPADR